MSANLHVYVEIDPALSEGMSAGLLRRLEQGIYIAPFVDGRVRFEGLRFDTALVFDSFVAAVEALHVQAENDETLARLSGGSSTATGRWLSDKAAFLRIVAQEVVQRRARLWPDPAA
jgi:hypothetical protein